MRELARRKKEQSSRPQQQAASRLSAVPPLKGISAGVRSKNRHLQDFEALKQGHKKRKGVYILLYVYFYSPFFSFVYYQRRGDAEEALRQRQHE